MMMVRTATDEALQWVDEDEQDGAPEDLPAGMGGMPPMGGMGEDGGFGGLGKSLRSDNPSKCH